MAENGIIYIDEIDKITTSNFIDKLSNWSSVTTNSSKYKYEIATLNKENNKFSFTIKVTLKSNSNISKTSNNFKLSYKISPSVNQDLLNEKNRIDKLELSLNKMEFTKIEIEEILKNPNIHMETLKTQDNKNNSEQQKSSRGSEIQKAFGFFLEVCLYNTTV